MNLTSVVGKLALVLTVVWLGMGCSVFRARGPGKTYAATKEPSCAPSLAPPIVDFSVAASFALAGGAYGVHQAVGGAQATSTPPVTTASVIFSAAAATAVFIGSGVFGAVNVGECRDGWRQWAVAKTAMVNEVAAVASQDMSCPVDALSVQGGDFTTPGWVVVGCKQKYLCVMNDRISCQRHDRPRLRKDDYGFRGIAEAVATQTGCDPTPLDVTTTVPKQRSGTAGFRAVLCGRSFDCVAGVNSRNDVVEDETTCTETAESTRRVDSMIVVKRLELETGCPEAQVRVLGQFLIGAESAYRLEACGKTYVCTTAAGKTTCKAALAE